MLAPTGTAFAFEPYEHRAMGNLGYRIAIHHYATLFKTPNAAFTSDEMEAIYAFFHTDMVRNQASYGQVVQCVDEFLIPEKMFNLGVKQPNQPWYPRRRDEIQVGEDGCYGKAGTIFSRFGGRAAAGHANHTHFQDDLLVALNMHHSAAMAIAAGSRGQQDVERLFGALAMNGIADHYLQDFFAPGHMVTARANLTDTLSNSTHDLANEAGIDYVIDTRTRDWIVELAPVISDNGTLDLLCRRPAPTNGAVDTVLPSGDSLCVDEAVKLLKKFPTSVLLKGDGRLWRPRESGDDLSQGLTQRILMAAVVARSVIDVIEAYKGNWRNSFELITWDFARPESSTAASSELEGLAFKVVKAAQRRLSQDRELKVSFGFGSYIVSDRDPDPGNVSVPPTPGSYRIPETAPLLGVQLARESMFNGDRFGRGVFTAYVSPFCYFCFQKEGIPNLIPSFGVVYMKEDKFSAWGGEARISAILPNTETTLSLYLRKTSYRDGANSRWGSGTGLRLEQGFSSILSLFVGAGKDYGETSKGSLERGWMFFAGANLTFPWAHTKKYVRDARVERARSAPAQ